MTVVHWFTRVYTWTATPLPAFLLVSGTAPPPARRSRPPFPPSHSHAGYTSYDRIVLSAHSAGGVVAAGLVQRDPGAVGALVLEAPFLDVLTVQCRPDLALTVHEYEEWGDPHSTAGFLQARRGGVVVGRARALSLLR